MVDRQRLLDGIDVREAIEFPTAMVRFKSYSGTTIRIYLLAMPEHLRGRAVTRRWRAPARRAKA